MNLNGSKEKRQEIKKMRRENNNINHPVTYTFEKKTI